MGLIDGTLRLLFGEGRNVLRDTAGAFWESPEAEAARDAARQRAALDQFAAEFAGARRSAFDRLIDGVNRLPRPALALGTLGLFVAAMVDPVWFAARMNGIALVPEPLWWLMGAIVSFYFGARHQAKAHDFRRALARTTVATGTVLRNIASLDALEAGRRAAGDANPALEAWVRNEG
ncbi:carboxylesterase [Maritimibacter sp. DP07]|uniref:Carboxylesterase n=1 Tax=Maritimibacter harenae TaxID=2606218 RepID=A0A845M3S3_9RHOB|nr:holin family protein [Maritimibacter harenae]MZR13048.1 carboxylesterase [Maritimibacter harenae]